MKILFTLTIALMSLSVQAQLKLVKDIMTGPGDANPNILGVVNGKTIFIAKDAAHGLELWVTDGTSNGTQLLKDILTGTDGSNPNGYLVVNNKLFFIARDSAHGLELWVTDGTVNGTNLVLDISNGFGAGVDAAPLASLNGLVYFNASSPLTGKELWVSDGTANGTKMVKDINTGIGNSSDPKDIYAVFGKIYFSAITAATGRELWYTDGTDTGTHMVADLMPGTGDGYNYNGMGFYNGKIYFTGRESTAIGYELYSSDGYTINLVKNIDTVVNSGFGANSYYTAFNKLFFTSRADKTGAELFVTDGTTVGTTMVKDIDTAANNSGSPIIVGMVNGKLLMRGFTQQTGQEMWASNGTDTGTKVLKDIYPGKTNGYIFEGTYPNNMLSATNPVNPYVYNDKLYFTGQDTSSGKELWVTDGTDTGTKKFLEIGKIPDTTVSGRVYAIYIQDTTMWVSCDNGVTGIELYSYNMAPDTTDTSQHVGNIVKRVISLSPNPNNGSFLLKLDDNDFHNGYLQVVDVTGREVYSQSFYRGVKHLPVRLPMVPPGLYALCVSLDGQVMTEKILVE